MATNNAVNNSLTSQTGTGNFVGSTSPTLTTPKIVTQINDSNGNAIVGLGATGSAVNYLTITNQVTGTPPFLSSSGTDTNIPINLQSKGDSPINFLTTALTNPFTIVSGTAGQHVTSFSFSNTSASRSVTYPDLTGTVALSGASQDVSFNTVTTTQIKNSSGDINLSISGMASSVNYLTSYSSSTGSPVQIFASGNDANIGLQISTKGQGALAITAGATGNPVTLYSGTNGQHATNFNFANTAANQTVTFPDLTGTVALSGASQNVTFNSVSWSDTTKGIVGTTTNNSASAGYVGEFISSVILSGSKVTLTANVAANITSISLTAGDWDVWGNVNTSSTAQTQTYSFAWISTTSATQPADAYIQGFQMSQPYIINNYRAITPLRFSLNATTTVYLSVVGDGGGTLSGWGAIYARRVR